jgi:hypothetical protein
MPYKIIEKMKSLSKKCETKNLEKKLIKVYNQDYENYDIGCAINYIKEKEVYEVYMFVGTGKDTVASNLLCNFFNNEDQAYKYYNELVSLAEKNDLDLILKKLEENKPNL